MASSAVAEAAAAVGLPKQQRRRRGGSFLYRMGNLFSTAATGATASASSGGSVGRRQKQQQQQQQQQQRSQSDASATAAAAAGASASNPAGAASADGERANPALAVADADGRAECPVCAESLPAAEFPALLLDCGHFACRGCLVTALRLAISDGMPATCLACSARLHPDDVNAIVGEERLRIKYEQFTLRRVLASDPDCRWCPAPDCKYAVIASGCASCPQLECPVCGISFCYHCKTEWHPNTTCEQARIQRQKAEVLAAAAAAAAREGPDVMLAPASLSDQPMEIKQCPRCATYISKENDGSCNHMRCKLCGAEFCWLCRKEINDLHYLSPSGCTFWGKKPWSRKKKILWQLGTLVGAPVGIALLAGLAVPAIIVGVPVWAGKRVRHRLKKAGRHTPAQRRCLVALTVAGSLVASPLIAVITVGVAVPVLLAYVYGVVPVSLCRSGGCAAAEREGEGAEDPQQQLPPQFSEIGGRWKALEGVELEVVAVATDGGGRTVRVRADVSPPGAAADAVVAVADDASVAGLTGSLEGNRNPDCTSASGVSSDGSSCQQQSQIPPAATSNCN